MNTGPIAIIDLGTNTFHLLIASPNGSILHREQVAVRIGKGGINRKVITDDGLDRAINALKTFKETITRYNVGSIRAFGTSALRDAANKQVVLHTILNKTGISVEIISGDREAELIAKGVLSAIRVGNQRCLIMDIGGGSVEFIIADEKKLFWKRSFDIGGQRLLEMFQHHDPITPDEIAALNNHLDTSLTELFDALRQFKPTILAGSSGTFDTLSEIHSIRKGIRIEKDQPETPLTFDAIHEIHHELITNDRAARMAIPGMIELRVDMIVVASCLIAFVLDRYSFQEVRVSSYSLKEGVLAEIQDSKFKIQD